MKNGLKFLILFLALTILTGCTTYGEIEINKDNNAYVTISLSENMDYVNGFIMEDDDQGDSLVRKWLNNTLSMYKKEYSDMNISYTTSSNEYVGNATKKINNINELKNLKILKENFNTVNADTTNGIVNIELKGLNEELLEQIGYYENSVTVKIKLPFVVLDSNVSSINEVDNIYTWNLSNAKKDIIIKYDTNQIYKYNPNKLDSTRKKVVIIGSCIVGGLVVVAIILSLKSKNKK